MRLINRKTPMQRLLTTAKSVVPGVGSVKALKTGLIAAGSLAGLTAGSAAVSSLRRRKEAASEGS
jgi:hypothetical protein